MANITRKHHKIFASSATNNGQFGSAQLGTKINSNDPDVIQALSAYDQGWNSATTGGTELPTLEEMQGLQYNNSYQIAYLLQKGIPEWNTSTDYYIGDIAREIAGTKFYKSITDNNIGNALTDINNWEFLGNFGLATTTTQGISYLNKPVTITNNATDADHDMDFGAGNFDFDDGSGQATLSALTKQFDATFALGTNAGGMVSGESLPADGFVYVYQISNENGTITDIIGTTTADGSTISGDSVVSANSLTKKKYLCALPTGASSNIRNGNYTTFIGGYKFEFGIPVLNFQKTITSTTPTPENVTVPNKNNVTGFFSVYLASSTPTGSIRQLYVTSVAQSSTILPRAVANINFVGANSFNLICINSQVNVFMNVGNSNTSSLQTEGWEEKY
jgi:hypothetical protein